MPHLATSCGDPAESPRIARTSSNDTCKPASSRDLRVGPGACASVDRETGD